MKRNNDDKLTDILLGEAIMAIISSSAPITNTALLRHLQAMNAVEEDEARRKACQRAINEVRSSTSTVDSANNDKSEVREVRDGDNVVHMFTSEGPPDGTAKH